MRHSGKEVTRCEGFEVSRSRFNATCFVFLLFFLGCSNESLDVNLADQSDGVQQSSGIAERAPTTEKAADQPSGRIQEAASRFERGDLDDALALVLAELVANPNEPRALQLAMAIRGRKGEYSEAGQLARQLAEVDVENASQILLAAFDMHLRAGEFGLAEQDLILAETANPSSGQVQRRLAQFLNAQGRRHEASVHVLNLIRLRIIQPDELLSLVDRRGPFFLVSFDEFSKEGKKDLFELGQIRLRYSATRSDRDAELQATRELADAFPDEPALWAFYGRLLVEMEKYDLMEQWVAEVPPGVDQQPEYWNAIGSWMVHQQRDDEAIRAFAEAINLDPGDRESMRSMMAIFLSRGENQVAETIRQRLADLDRLFRIAKEARREEALWISNMMQEHARPWESSAWYLFAAQAGNQFAQVLPELDQRHASISKWERSAPVKSLEKAKFKQLLGFAKSDWPVPDLSTVEKILQPEVPSEYQRGIKLVNTAVERGLTTSFVSGFPLDGEPMFPHQANGGGIAAFDYDMDGRCDLYFVQSGGSPTVVNSSQPNQLYRSIELGGYQDLSAFADVQDRGFGQGVCVGDVNQDGLPDLLLANIGSNVIYLNQGDGTFAQSDHWLQDQQGKWTSSLGLADLDGDRLPDLIEVNYIDDEQAFEISCTDNYLDCQPQAFRKCKDVVYRLKGEGGFELWQEGFLSEVTPKLGFGVVIANFDRRHGNDFFISNDGDLNHYWVSQPESADRKDRFRLRESGTLLGCSIGRGGNSQACMGVAYGDFNRDGTLDLHVTNFLEEPVNLFLQSTNGTFVDEAMRYRLADSSRGVLGFGTQAIDFDNDGWLDLAVLNGHVFDGRVDDLPFRMQPQMMRGSERGFVLQEATEVGNYWGQKSVGRTLAVLDFNQDGRMDLVGNHLDRPVALLENQSESLNWIQVELVGCVSERDAIGAEVVVHANGEMWTAWQTGGDGLMATNEQVLHFGVAEAKKIDSLEVLWPTGEKQRFTDLSVNERYLIVEGQSQLHPY